MKKPRTKRPKPPATRHVSFRLPADVIAALDDAAAASHLSKTKVLELTLRAGLKNFGSAKRAVAAVTAEPDTAQISLFD